MSILQSVFPKLGFPTETDAERIHKIAVSRILPNPAQPRKYFDNGETLRLADSIRTHGILQPLCVRKSLGTCQPLGADRARRGCGKQ